MGEALHAEVEPGAFGALVVGPVTRRSRAGSESPRIAETHGGIVLDTGAQNRGLDATLKHFAATWARSPVPVIVQLIEGDPRVLGEMCARLASAEGVAAIEWMPAPTIEVRTIRTAIESMQMESDLPLLLRPPFARTAEWGKIAAQSSVDALVVGAPPQGAVSRTMGSEKGAQSAIHGTTIVTGSLYGPGVFPLMLAALVEASQLALNVPLIASGGIFTLEQAQTALSVGATALQIDALAWLEPAAATAIARNHL